jgi:hypothetical protein
MNESHEDPSVEIRSSRGRRSLRFHSRSGDSFAASIEGDGPQATKSIWGYTDCAFLVQLFESIAGDWKGWQGERSWESIEHDLRLAITSSSTGRITILVTLRDYHEEQDWEFTIPIFTEAGQLESIARQVGAFFR